MRYVFLGMLCAAAILAESAGGVAFKAPAGWKSQGARPMRAATYTVPAASGDAEPGEVAVFYFGQGQGGDVDANIKRWTAQFQTNEKPRIRQETVNGLPVTSIDLSGTYVAASGPMMANKVNKPGYRLLGAIVEGPQGAVFFKFTGPAKTVAAQQDAFQTLVKSVRKQ
jgi:hypothetical protein